MKYHHALVLAVVSLIAGGVFSFPLVALSKRSSASLWLADEVKGAEEGKPDSESDRLLSEIAELTESFEYVQKKNENNRRLYKERITRLQSQISELQTQLQVAESSSTSSSSSSSRNSEAVVHDATVIVDEGLSQMRLEWEKEKQILLDEKEALARSIASLKQSIHDEARSMRSDMKREYVNLKANAIQERDAALRKSEAMRRELEAERMKRIQLEGSKKERRTGFGAFWKRLKSVFRRRNEW